MNQISHIKDRSLWKKLGGKKCMHRWVIAIVTCWIFIVCRHQSVMCCGIRVDRPKSEYPTSICFGHQQGHNKCTDIQHNTATDLNGVYMSSLAACKRMEVQNSLVTSKVKQNHFRGIHRFIKNYRKGKWFMFGSLQYPYSLYLSWLRFLEKDKRIFSQQIWTGHNPRKWFFFQWFGRFDQSRL